MSVGNEGENVPSETRSPSERVINSVADVAGVHPTELPPLYDTIDPDALDSLFVPDGSSDLERSITFAYAGYEVSIRGDDTVTVEDVE